SGWREGTGAGRLRQHRQNSPGSGCILGTGRHRADAATLRRVRAYNPTMDEKESRIVEARLKLRERFLNRMKQTPGASDSRALARPKPEATHLMTHAYDGYTTNLPLEEALKDDVLLVHTAQGKPLPVEHGGPVRIITPQLYAWKGAKWIHRIELLTRDRLGYW